MPQNDSNLYEQVVQVARHYLGPAADRFVARQIRTHLQKEPEALAGADISELVDWIKLAVALLTEDTKLINEFTQRLLHLSNDNVGSSHA